MRRWALCIGVISACSGSDASAPTVRARDAAVPVSAHSIDAAAATPFPARPTEFPSCSTTYAPRPDRDPSPMCYVRGGSYEVQGLGYEPKGMDKVQLDDFLIDQHEVTAEQFVRFLNEAWPITKCGNPDDLCRNGGPSPLPPVVYKGGKFEARKGQETLPMIWVYGDEARAYCAWAGKELPTYGQWDVAAHVGPSGKRTTWTWGDDWKKGMMNCSEEDCADGFKEAAPPGSLHDTSAWGAMDMEGNVEERVTGCAGTRCGDYSAGVGPLAIRDPTPFTPIGSDGGLGLGLRCSVTVKR